MMEKVLNICFICLERCRNKVCSTCECYAHKSCWGKFVQKIRNVYINIDDIRVRVMIDSKTECPQCKELIYIGKALTRSDTYYARYLSLFQPTFIFLLCNIDGNDVEILPSIFELIYKNKSLLEKDKFISGFIKSKLKKLQPMWPRANFYNYMIFGNQIEQ